MKVPFETQITLKDCPLPLYSIDLYCNDTLCPDFVELSNSTDASSFTIDVLTSETSDKGLYDISAVILSEVDDESAAKELDRFVISVNVVDPCDELELELTVIPEG